MQDRNRWSRRADLAAELYPPNLERKRRTAIDRTAELAVAAEALGRAWRQSGGVLTPAIRAALDALASR